MPKAAKKELKLEFHKDMCNRTTASIYVVNFDRTKRYTVSWTAAPNDKVLAAKAWIKEAAAEWLEEHPEWILVSKEEYEAVKPSR